MTSFKLSNDTNDYNINSIEVYHFNHTSRFGVHVRFERNSNGIITILINYHMICAMLVFVASINFLIDPKVVPGRAGMLVTLFLVLANLFTGARVTLDFYPQIRILCQK